MTKIKIKHLIWDEWNIEHIKKHKVDVKEAVETGKNLIYHQRTHKSRFLAVGRSGNRIITLILSRKDVGEYYLVTARDSDNRERRKLYEKENK
jgi:hypothetical protein